jgi:predicted aspartyl protease
MRAVGLSFALIGLCSHFAAGRKIDSVPFASSGGAVVTVAVKIGGTGPFRFLLDTGSSRSAVTETLAASLRMQAVASTVVVTAAGTERRAVVRLGHVAVGNALVEQLTASVVSASSLDGDGPRLDGILGQDFLSGFDYTLDYRARRLVWDAAAPASATRFTLRRSEGRFLVELPQGSGDAQLLRLVPDSGADGLVLFARAGVVALPTSARRDAGRVTTVTGARAAQSVRVRALQIGDLTWRNRAAVVVDRSGPDAPEGDGLLPLHGFGRVSFNSTHSYIAFERW